MRREAEPFSGDHCETVTLGTLFGAAGLGLSEAELFGLGRGLGFFFIPDTLMRMPMLAGRIEPGDIMENAARACGVGFRRFTGKGEDAWAQLVEAVSEGKPVAVQLDCYYLEYFRRPVHFAGHWVAVVGIEEEQIWLAETQSQGKLCATTRERFMQAWGETDAPLANPWQGWVLEGVPTFEGASLREALRLNALEYLAGAAAVFDEAAGKLSEWLEGEQGARDAARAAVLAERAGTGGANFRRLFSLSVKKAFPDHAPQWSEIAQGWEAFAGLLAQYGETQAVQYKDAAVAAFARLAQSEREAMQALSAAKG